MVHEDLMAIDADLVSVHEDLVNVDADLVTGARGLDYRTQ